MKKENEEKKEFYYPLRIAKGRWAGGENNISWHEGNIGKIHAEGVRAWSRNGKWSGLNLQAAITYTPSALKHFPSLVVHGSIILDVIEYRGELFVKYARQSKGFFAAVEFGIFSEGNLLKSEKAAEKFQKKEQKIIEREEQIRIKKEEQIARFEALKRAEQAEKFSALKAKWQKDGCITAYCAQNAEDLFKENPALKGQYSPIYNHSLRGHSIPSFSIHEVAKCIPCSENGLHPNNHSCECGFYFFYDLDDLKEAAPRESKFMRILRAEFFGRIVLHEKGGRAEYRRLIEEVK